MTKLNLVIEYLMTCTVVKFILVLELVEIIVILISFLCFNWIYYNHSIYMKWKYYFKQLPILNKIIMIWFSIFYAIPNKIWINNNFSTFSVAFFIFLIVVLASVFPAVILLYVIFWITVLESYFFAVFYENKISFRNFINNKLFKGNVTFAKEYFNFFWGNMNSGGAGKGKAGIIGSFLGGLYQIARNQEKNHVREKGRIETQTHIQNAVQKPQTPAESLEIQKKVEDHIVERDTILLKGEKQVQDFSKKALDWFNNS